MGSINLDNTGSGGAITLSSDGTSLLLGGSAIGGGADLYAAETTGSTDPTASGTLSIAIGSSAIATGNDSIAIGNGADVFNSRTGAVAIGPNSGANGDYSVAIGEGTNTYSGTTGSLAIGRSAQAVSQSCVAIGKSRASGVESFAAVIDNNTSTYGATGANSIAIGYRTKATNTSGTSIGRFTEATGQESQAIGSYSIATALRSSSFGYQADATHSNSMSLGVNVTSTATDQVNVGGSTQTVRISETYTLPTADGSANQVLTTNGSGVVTFADAGGGADLYAANESSPSAQPSATGANAIAIGDSAIASGTNSIALGWSQSSGQEGVSIAIDSNTTNYGAQGINSLAMGRLSKAVSTSSVAIGEFASSNSIKASAMGTNAVASGSFAHALTNSYASGSYSFAAAIANNTSSYGATGSGAAALMNYAKATGSNSGAFGFGANATNWGSHALGAQTFATGDSSVSLGRNSLASATYSICIGNAGQNNIQSSIKFSGSQHANQGDAQIGLYPLMADTTDATATAMVTNHQSTPSAGTANQIVLPNNSAYAFHGTIVARQKAGDGTACAAWKIEGLIRREANAGTTVLVNSATTVLDNTPSWGMALSADTTNGGLKVQVTGAASTNIRWTTSITTSELIYA